MIGHPSPAHQDNRCPACAHSYPTAAAMMACFYSHGQGPIGRRLRDRLEAFAGYNPPAATGTRWIEFGECHGGKHGAECRGSIPQAHGQLRCSCACHQPDPAEWDAAYGSPWWAEQAEAE